jgi:hypothetical protein
MRIAVYEGKKRVGFIRLTKDGQGIHAKYVASIHFEKSNATVFKDDYSLTRGFTIARRCFPGRIMDVEF